MECCELDISTLSQNYSLKCFPLRSWTFSLPGNTLTTLNLSQQVCVPYVPSFQFPNQIVDTLYEKWFKDCVSSLQGEDVAQLVGWLDNVRFPITFFTYNLI